MSDARAQELLDLGNQLFTLKEPLGSLCQEIAEQCYPERADFTSPHNLGDDFAAHLSDSFPVIARRELGNSFSAILRPRDKNWFAATTNNEALDQDAANARFLDYVTQEVRSYIYDPRTDMIGATKMVDHDYAAFGNAVLSIEEYRKTADGKPHLYFRPHHFRDVAWLENEVSVVDHLHRKDRMTARAMERRFGYAKLHDTVKRACEKEPHKEVQLRVVVMPADEYDYVRKPQGTGKGRSNKPRKLPFVICYIDADNCKILREGGLHDFIYMVARWHRIPGFQYAFSPAAMTALPDSRMAQELALLILEAGERAVHPPYVAREEAFTQANLQAGSFTWADIQGDEKVSDVIMSLPPNGDMKVGFAMRQDLRELLSKSWFLDKLQLPEAAGADMTAYEVARRIEDHVRNLLPLFEPMEVEYNTKMLDKSFSTCANMGCFNWDEMPRLLAGKDIYWSFKNPMQAASTRILISQFKECLELIGMAQQFGVSSSPIQVRTALKDAVRGVGVPATWRTTEEEEMAQIKDAAMRQKLASAAQELGQITELAGKAGEAAGSLRDAGLARMPFQPDGVPTRAHVARQAQEAVAAPQQRLALPAPRAA